MTIDIVTIAKYALYTGFGIGVAVTAKQYYDYNKTLKIVTALDKEVKRRKANCFTIDRLIDGNCNGDTLSVGIHNKRNPSNVLSNQGIRYGQYGDIKSLESYIKTDNQIRYEFADNTTLTLSKTDANTVLYAFKSNDISVTKEMDNKILGMYKTIGLNSDALDKIAELK
jgi:hypothetical protein